MKGKFSIIIPTKPYIKAYMMNLYGSEPIMDRKDNIGNKFYDLLVHATNERKTEYPKLRYSTTIKLYVTYRTFSRRGCNLNETNIMALNGFIEDEIKRMFYFMMNTYVAIFPSFEANLPKVRSNLGIDEEDWSTDSMKKDYYRYRKQNNLPSFYNKNSARIVPSEKAADKPF